MTDNYEINYMSSYIKIEKMSPLHEKKLYKYFKHVLLYEAVNRFSEYMQDKFLFIASFSFSSLYNKQVPKNNPLNPVLYFINNSLLDNLCCVLQEIEFSVFITRK